MYSDIMRISRLRMASDGTGVSTLVAFWGFPLHCKYCINDQCHDRGNEYPEVERAAYTPQELVEILSKDDLYYKMTGEESFLKAVNLWYRRRLSMKYASWQTPNGQ